VIARNLKHEVGSNDE